MTAVNLDQHPDVTAFFDAQSNTISYLVKDPASTACAVVDAVMQFDYASGRLSYDSADEIIAAIKAQGLTLEWIIESHVHADHLSGAPYFQQKLGGKIGIGEHITEVQDTLAKCSMRALSLNVMARNSTSCLKMATGIAWGR